MILEVFVRMFGRGRTVHLLNVIIRFHSASPMVIDSIHVISHLLYLLEQNIDFYR